MKANSILQMSLNNVSTISRALDAPSFTHKWYLKDLF